MGRVVDHDEIGVARSILDPLGARHPGNAAKSKPMAFAPSRPRRNSTQAARLPCGSMSSRATRAPWRAQATATCAASVVLPAPPFRCAIVITNPGIDPALAEVDGTITPHPSFPASGGERVGQGSGGSGEVEAVQVHHLGPRRHEVVHELLLRVRAGID